MKKLLIALSILLSIQLSAQTKEAATALKNFEKAKKSADDPKKATNPATWLSLSSAYLEVYEAPIKALWLDASQMEIKVLLKDQRITGTSETEVNGEKLSVNSYYDKDLYFRPDGSLAAWKITKPYMDGDLLSESFDALNKGIDLDTKGTKTKEFVEILNSLEAKYKNNAMAAYNLGDIKSASVNFEAALKCSSHKLVNKFDSTMAYYTALTANMEKDYDRAIKYFQLCIENGYEVKGDVYSYLAEIYKSKGDMTKAKELLGTAFSKYPTSQSVLVSLINAYMETNDDPKKVLDFIHQAQKNEPQNASLLYAEGNVWKKLNEMDKAIEMYKKSSELDPNYYFGNFAIGAAYYDKAVEIQTKAAEELDDAKYDAMVKQLEASLEAAIEPFEKCFAVTTDPEVKKVCAEYLKNIYFRFRDRNETFKANYDKYNSFLGGEKK
jgi:tetratricopeptide (TPR) repeat protein